MILLDLCDDILEMVGDHVFVYRKRLLIKNLQRWRNHDSVLCCWSLGAPHKTVTLRTDGDCIFSYGLKIGYTERGNKMLINYTARGNNYVSHTTSTHVNKAHAFADKMILLKDNL